jgi:hypothetical protein
MFDFLSEETASGANITNEADSYFGLSQDEDEELLELIKAKPLLRSGAPPSLNDLAVSRPAPPILSADEEARLIAAAQAGDSKAARQLVMHHLMISSPPASKPCGARSDDGGRETAALMRSRAQRFTVPSQP